MENNYLNNHEVEKLIRELAQAKKEGKEPKAIFEKYQQISETNRQAMLEECGNNPICYLPHIYQMGTGNEAVYENLSALRVTSYVNGLSNSLKGKMAIFVEDENANSYAALPSSVHYASMAIEAGVAVGGGSLSLREIKGYLTKQPIVTPLKGYKKRTAYLTGGEYRSNLYSKNWETASLSEAINKFAGHSPNIIITEKEKRMYENTITKIQVVEDLNGKYFRIFDPNISVRRSYLDLKGDIPSNKVLDNGKIMERSQGEYNRTTYFNIGE